MNDNNIEAMYLSLANTVLSTDILYDISIILKKKNNAIKCWDKLKYKIFFIYNIKDIRNVAQSIHEMGYRAHNIAREFCDLDETYTAIKIHKVGEYYHLIGEKILDQIFKWHQTISLHPPLDY